MKYALFCCVLICCTLLSVGCGNYTSTTRVARDEFYAGQYTESAKILEKGAHEEGVNQLLFLMDRALALFQAGNYEESIQDFLLADKLSEIKDYTSLSTETASFFTNDKIIPYKGEDFEKVLISQYLALAYLFLNKYEDALVECRRVNHKLYMMIHEGKRKYKLNPMASYVSALIYENQNEWADAYIDYQAVYKLVPDFPFLGNDLYRLAWLTKNQEDMQKWASQYQLTSAQQKQIKETSKWPELVVFVENGYSPQKRPNPSWEALPEYEARSNPIEYAGVFINGNEVGRSYPIFSIEQTAIENLNEKYAAILAKKLAGVVVKEVVAQQVDKKVDPVFGALMRLGLHAVNQADLRSWLTLPKDFQVFRYRIQAENDPLQVKIYSYAKGGSIMMNDSKQIEKLIHFDQGKSINNSRKKIQNRVFLQVRI